MYVKRKYIWNPSTCACENNIYLKSIVDSLVITCDEIIDGAAKSYDNVLDIVSIKLNDKKAAC